MNDKQAFGYAFIFFLYGGWEITGTWIIIPILFLRAVLTDEDLSQLGKWLKRKLVIV